VRGLRRLWGRHSRGMPSPRIRGPQKNARLSTGYGGEGRVRGRPCFAGPACREQRPNLRPSPHPNLLPVHGRRDQSGPMGQILEAPGTAMTPSKPPRVPIGLRTHPTNSCRSPIVMAAARPHWEVERRCELGMQTALQRRSLGCGAAPPHRRLNPVRSNAP
jgi:hypothetical protein